MNFIFVTFSEYNLFDNEKITNSAARHLNIFDIHYSQHLVYHEKLKRNFILDLKADR